eukprot:2800260-Amphidinium_carterae.1
MMLQDQLDVANLVGVELLFRRLQVTEYSYSDKLKERGVSSTGGRLTLEEALLEQCLHCLGWRVG